VNTVLLLLIYYTTTTTTTTVLLLLLLLLVPLVLINAGLIFMSKVSLGLSGFTSTKRIVFYALHAIVVV